MDDRGGLYEVNGDVFLLFKEIEKAMYVKLINQGTNPPFEQSSSKEELLQPVSLIFFTVSYNIQDKRSKSEL